MTLAEKYKLLTEKKNVAIAAKDTAAIERIQKKIKEVIFAQRIQNTGAFLYSDAAISVSKNRGTGRIK